MFLISSKCGACPILITLISAILIRTAKDYKLSQLLIMTFLWSPVISSHVHTFLSASCSPLPSVYVYLSWWNNQVSHPHKTMCNTTALCSTQIIQYCCCSETCKLCHIFMCYLYIMLLSCILLRHYIYLVFFLWSFLGHYLPKSRGATLKTQPKNAYNDCDISVFSPVPSGILGHKHFHWYCIHSALTITQFHVTSELLKH
jgi:hypothetical protein